MTKKAFIKFNSSIEYLNSISNNEYDFVFIETQFDNNKNFILSNNDNSVIITKNFDDLLNIKSKIYLIKLIGDNFENQKILFNILNNNINKLNNIAIIRVNDEPYISKTLEYIYDNSLNIYEILTKLITSSIDSESYFFNNNQINKFEIKSHFQESEYKFASIENSIKSSLNLLKSFSNNFNINKFFIDGYDELLKKNYFNDNDQKLYINNYFNSTFFKQKNQLKNPENFSAVFFEILNNLKNQITFGQILINSFLEAFFIDNIEKINTNSISANLKKIQLIASNFDKYDENIQNIFILQFIENLQKEKSNNLILLYTIFFAENIIYSESKKKFIIEAFQSEFFINRAIELNLIFNKKPKLLYTSLFNAENFEYSFSEASINAYFEVVDKDNLMNMLVADYKTKSIFSLFFKKKFINYIITNSQLFVLSALVNAVNKKYDDIEKNKIRYAISANIFSSNFIEFNIDKIKILYKILPLEVIQKIPPELINNKKNI